jgi:hypothetical protein
MMAMATALVKEKRGKKPGAVELLSLCVIFANAPSYFFMTAGMYNHLAIVNRYNPPY